MTTWLLRLDGDSAGDGPRLAVKDAIDVAGVPTTAACPVVSDLAGPADRDAAVVATARAQGARIVGKTNLTELCRAGDGVNPWTGTPTNPLDPTRIPGGSSSGSAVAVAVGEADVAYGTDTGGSVRIPAACCGIAGLKTTAGRLPTDGVFAFSATLDTVGPMARDVAGLVAGMRLAEPGFTVAEASGVSGPVARLRMPGPLPADPDIDAAVDAALHAAEFDVTDEPVTGWWTLVQAANHVMSVEGYAAHRHLLDRAARISPRIRAAIAAEAEVGPDHERAARDVGRRLRAGLDTLFERYAILALPTLSMPPPVLGEEHTVPLTQFTVPFNLAVLPALTLPVPRRGGLPASVQLVGPAGGEERLLALGAILEAAAAAS